MDAASEPVAACLRIAAPRLSGRLVFINRVPRTRRNADAGSEDAEERGAFELPCLEGASSVILDLGGCLGLSLPLAGVFARLAVLSLSCLRFHGPFSLGNAVSSSRCPCLKKLSVRDVRGLFSLSINSESLIQLDLRKVVGLQQLAIDAPVLKEMKLDQCFVKNQPIANISAPELVTLHWRDEYDPSSMQLGKMAKLQLLLPNVFLVHGDGHHDSFDRSHNRNCRRFLQQFQAIQSLTISLGYPKDISNSQYLLGDITFLPSSAILTVMVVKEGHAFGAGLYHVLRLCPGIKSLFLVLDSDLEESDERCLDTVIPHMIFSIFVVTKCDTPDFVAAWLPLAARRLSGYLVYENLVEGHEEEVDRAIPLPCFGNATEIDLELGFLALSLPSSGVFTGLTELCLKSVRFLGPCDLDDVVSSPRCPGLRRLRVRKTRGLHGLAIQSKSLLKIDLGYLNGLQKLSIDASALKKLTLLFSFRHHQPVADISAPQLVFFRWRGAYDPSSVQLGNLGQLQRLSTYFIRVYGQQVSIYNRAILQLLHRFQVIHNLNIMLGYPQDIGELQYLMEDITRLPRVTFLELVIFSKGHAFGASSFHVLRLCTGIKKLSLVLRTSIDFQAHECPSGCPCDEQTNWKIDELLLNRLEEVELTNLKGAEYEVTFVKQLFSWATVLRKMRITFANLVSESMASELRERLLTFSRPEVCVEFKMGRRPHELPLHLLAVEG
ncbi:hypothetical protein EJB05_13882 [Eragrostis curvula]|uniref:FBD domain-containing protein n=1 Tax=Eragrostis curvula TaxID=38414 RepID=A0A5J9VWV7_9POAL|nr:hypothetical protein EJB05_13882 [Eragrostis curvula]